MTPECEDQIDGKCVAPWAFLSTEVDDATPILSVDPLSNAQVNLFDSQESIRSGGLSLIPNYSQNWEQEQPNGHYVVKECNDGSTRNQTQEGRLRGISAQRPLVAGACNHPNVPSIPFSFAMQANHIRQRKRER
jgi:hypothetical protein